MNALMAMNVITMISLHVHRGIIAQEEATYKKTDLVQLDTFNRKLVHKDVYLASEEAIVQIQKW